MHISRIVRSLILIGLTSVSYSAATDKNPIGPTIHGRNRATISTLPNGGLLVDDVAYESRQAYYRSAQFRAAGGPCGAPIPDAASAPRGVGSASDCDLFSTSLSSVYQPNNGRYRIPVVVHVITNAAGVGALTEANIRGQIDVLNEAFRGNGALGPNTEIDFYLATEDPAGNPTSGITTTANSAWFVENGDYWQTLAWDTSRYLNVYTLKLDDQGLLGYVPDFPASGNLVGTLRDRVVVHWGSFGAVGFDGPPNDQGDVLVHEVGHYLGLFHTFHESFFCSDADAPGCYSSGDLICDTNPQFVEIFTREDLGCPPNMSCGSPDSIDNFMSYSEEACMYRFTPEQVQRMRCTLINHRPNLYEVVSDTGVLSINPPAGEDHIGLLGGPFSPTQTAYTMSNPGNSPVDYQIVIDSNFGLLVNGGVNVVSGSLPGGLNRQVAITLDESVVNALPIGTYQSTILFRDLTNAVQYTRIHTLTVGRVYQCMEGGPVSIPDNNTFGVTSTVTFPTTAYIEDIDLQLSITHTFVGDLAVSITHIDSGTTATMLNAIGSSGGGFTCDKDNFNAISLDDEGTGGSISIQCAGNLTSPPGYVPQDALSIFDGLDIKGTWRIRVADNGPTDVGTLDDWCLIASISDTPPMEEMPEPMIMDTDFDTVPDETDNCPETPNPDQSDINGNGIGDVCESIALSDCPNTITLPATAANGAPLDFALPTAAGGFGNIQVFATPASGTTFPIGTTTVTITATDGTGAKATCTFDVIVTDDGTIPNPKIDGEECGSCGAGAPMVLPIMLLGFGVARRRGRRR